MANLSPPHSGSKCKITVNNMDQMFQLWAVLKQAMLQELVRKLVFCNAQTQLFTWRLSSWKAACGSLVEPTVFQENGFHIPFQLCLNTIHKMVSVGRGTPSSIGTPDTHPAAALTVTSKGLQGSDLM